jgi:hypothetical protein
MKSQEVGAAVPQADRLREKLARLLLATARVSVKNDRLDGMIQGVPRDSIIELHSYEVGRPLNREIQRRHMAAFVNIQVGGARCPALGTSLALEPAQCPVTSIDGAVDLQELEGYCRTISPVFFPFRKPLGFVAGELTPSLLLEERMDRGGAFPPRRSSESIMTWVMNWPIDARPTVGAARFWP